jgi:aminoglycoside phosphotransferase family enzyme
MLTQDQADVIAFLAAPSTHGTETVDRIDTHSAIVFLAGEHAYKLKRAVRFDYLDFSTVERRRAMCDAEVRLNRRTAPDIYRGVVAITRERGGALALGGSGSPNFLPLRTLDEGVHLAMLQRRTRTREASLSQRNRRLRHSAGAAKRWW